MSQIGPQKFCMTNKADISGSSLFIDWIHFLAQTVSYCSTELSQQLTTFERFASLSDLASCCTMRHAFATLVNYCTLVKDFVPD